MVGKSVWFSELDVGAPRLDQRQHRVETGLLHAAGGPREVAEHKRRGRRRELRRKSDYRIRGRLDVEMPSPRLGETEGGLQAFCCDLRMQGGAGEEQPNAG